MGTLFTVRTIEKAQMQSIAHGKHVASPLQGPTGQCCLGKQSLLIVRTKRSTEMHCVGSMPNCNMLKKVVCIFSGLRLFEG
jgi:hypothetical protein